MSSSAAPPSSVPPTSSAPPRLARSISMPRPLKSKPQTSDQLVNNNKNSNTPELLSLLESVCGQLINGAPYADAVATRVKELNLALKAGGGQLDSAPAHKEATNRLMTSLRNACKDPALDKVSRLLLLEVVELRAMEWKANENVENYYKQKLALFEMEATEKLNALHRSQSLNANAPEYTPPKATSTPAPVDNKLAKRSMSWKEEMVIRNADSGKVGPGATERLIQISGDSPASVSHARKLMEDTIRRNVTPPPPATTTAATPQYLTTPPPFHCAVEVGGDRIQISGLNKELIQTAQLVLENYFGNENTGTPPIPSPQPQSSSFVVTRQPLFPASSKEAMAEAAKQGRTNTRRASFAATAVESRKRKDSNNNNSKALPAEKLCSYSRNELLDIGDTAPCKRPVATWPQIVLEFPTLLRKVGSEPFKPQREFSTAMFSLAALGTNFSEEDLPGCVDAIAMVKKRNFLEVLRPNAPLRAWNEALGEWVEVAEATRG